MKTDKRFVVYERFTFSDGVRFAWVTYELPVDGHHVGERRCVGVSESAERPEVQ